MTLDLFGVEVDAGESSVAGIGRKSGDRKAGTALAELSPSPAPLRRGRVVVVQEFPLKLDYITTTRKEREEFRDSLFSAGRAYPEPHAGPPLVDVRAIILRHFTAERDDAAPAGIGGVEPRGALTEELGRLARSVYTSPSQEKPPAESYPDARMRREVLAAKLESRTRPLVHTQTEFPPLWKLKGMRYLRALVRKHNYRLLPKNGAGRKCGRVRHSRTGVDFYATPGRDGNDRVSMAGVARCGSVWSCPSCAPRVSSERSRLLRQIIGAHRSTGGDVMMLTLTFPHDAGMSAVTLRRAQAEALKLFQQGDRWPELKREMGFVGSVRAVEVTHGGNGWHPHIHILLAVHAKLAEDVRARIEERCYERWCAAIARQDVMRLSAPSRENGVMLSACNDASYIVKLGLADELARAIDKNGRDGNRTPWQIMAQHAVAADPRDAAILREYHRGFKGARQLGWSRGRLLSCASCAEHAELPEAERRAQCPSRGYHGVDDLRRIYPPDVTDPLQLALLDGEDMNAEALAADDGKGVHIANCRPEQFDALVRVLGALGTDAEAELVNAMEEHGGPLGLKLVLESAYRRGREVAKSRPKLVKWVWWLDPRRRDDHARQKL